MSGMSSSEIIHAVAGAELLILFKNIKMKKSIIYYVLAVVSAVIAVIIFLKSFDWKSLLILLFGIAAALLFRQGLAESNKKE